MELSEEEKEAIEKLKQMEKFYNEFLNSGVEISLTLNEKDIEIIIKILNLIEKQTKVIEDLKEKNKEYEILLKRQEELQKEKENLIKQGWLDE